MRQRLEAPVKQTIEVGVTALEDNPQITVRLTPDTTEAPGSIQSAS